MIHPNVFVFNFIVMQVRMYACTMIYGVVAHVAPPPLSTSLIYPKEQQCCYSLAPVPSQELPERGYRQQRTALRAPTPYFSSRFTPEAFSMAGCGRKAAEVLKSEFSFEIDFPGYLPKEPENILGDMNNIYHKVNYICLPVFRVVIELAKKDYMVINDEDEDSNTALHLAALSGFSKTALALIKARANVEARWVHHWGFTHVLENLECSRFLFEYMFSMFLNVLEIIKFRYFGCISRKELHIFNRPTTSSNNPNASLTVCVAQNITMKCYHGNLLENCPQKP